MLRRILGDKNKPSAKDKNKRQSKLQIQHQSLPTFDLNATTSTANIFARLPNEIISQILFDYAKFDVMDIVKLRRVDRFFFSFIKQATYYETNQNDNTKIVKSFYHEHNEFKYFYIGFLHVPESNLKSKTPPRNTTKLKLFKRLNEAYIDLSSLAATHDGSRHSVIARVRLRDDFLQQLKQTTDSYVTLDTTIFEDRTNPTIFIEEFYDLPLAKIMALPNLSGLIALLNQFAQSFEANFMKTIGEENLSPDKTSQAISEWRKEHYEPIISALSDISMSPNKIDKAIKILALIQNSFHMEPYSHSLSAYMTKELEKSPDTFYIPFNAVTDEEAASKSYPNSPEARLCTSLESAVEQGYLIEQKPQKSHYKELKLKKDAFLAKEGFSTTTPVTTKSQIASVTITQDFLETCKASRSAGPSCFNIFNKDKSHIKIEGYLNFELAKIVALIKINDLVEFIKQAKLCDDIQPFDQIAASFEVTKPEKIQRLFELIPLEKRDIINQFVDAEVKKAIEIREQSKTPSNLTR